MKRSTVKEVPSGTIDIVWHKNEPYLQFNCSCDDALPYCRAMCCRMRKYTNVGLEPHEIGQYDAMQFRGLPILQIDPENDCCVYLEQEENRCKIHETKPENCRTWHCSPGGVGEGLTQFSEGWKLLPVFK